MLSGSFSTWDCSWGADLKRSLLSIIRCPDCHGKLVADSRSESGGEIEEGSLCCLDCNALFPIKRFIPRFVKSDFYTRSFSAEWNVFSKTQLDQGSVHDTRNTFIQKVARRPEELEGKAVLEAGCGMGRFLDIVAKHTSSPVVGFDLSLAVEAAFANLRSKPNVHILQADIIHPPFAEESFDFIYSIGVLHHTSNPRKAFARLVSLLRRDGEIAIWVYLRPRIPAPSDFYRKLTRRMPWAMVMALARVISNLYWANKNIRYLRWLIPISLEKDPERRLLDTFDWYSPRYQFKFTADEVVGWFDQLGLRDVRVLPFPVSVRGRR